jgi:hypothetical protein
MRAEVRGCQDRSYLLSEFGALLLAEALEVFFHGRRDRRPVIAMAHDSFLHPVLQQTDEDRRGHGAMFKIEERFKIKGPS